MNKLTAYWFVNKIGVELRTYAMESDVRWKSNERFESLNLLKQSTKPVI